MGLSVRALVLSGCVTFVSCTALGQYFPRWNFNVGGGVGFPEGTSANFANNGANFVVGGGPNFSSRLGLDAEFMWHDLPIKKNVINDLQVPHASAREYTVTANAIFRIPTHGKMGFYAIGGGGWYHRSGELTAPTYKPGTVCPPFWIWWGGCINGFFPAKVVLASSSSDDLGWNIGGGITYSLGGSHLKFYGETRYHHAPHKQINSDLLPLTFGLRW